MSTLLLQLAAPLQSWGSSSRFTYRYTDREPTKSGVLGLVCNVLGKDRDESREDESFPPLVDLSALRMGVRVDREGVVYCDFHTAGAGVGESGYPSGILHADGVSVSKNGVISYRYYLADAAFLVGLEGSDDALLGRLLEAFVYPQRVPTLGRAACIPALPIGVGVSPASLVAALKEHPLIERGTPGQKRLVVECSWAEDGDVRDDVPLRFGYPGVYRPRKVTTLFVRKELEDECLPEHAQAAVG